MKLKMYTVFDVKSEAYLQPFFMQTKGQALRAWITSVNDPNTNFCKYPGDFTLFEIGEFDDSNGVITMYDSKINLGSALEHQSKTQSTPLIKLAQPQQNEVQHIGV